MADEPKKGTPKPEPPEPTYLYDLGPEMIDTMYKAFNLVQKKSSKKKPNEVEEKDVGILIRSLGLNPTEQHVEKILEMARADEDPKHCTRGHVDFDNLQKKIATLIATDPTLSYRHSENEIIAALRGISVPGQDYIEPTDLYDIMTHQALTDDEVQMMIRTGKDKDTGKIWHEDYAVIVANDSNPKPADIIRTEVAPEVLPEAPPPPPPPAA